jgi:hypothetical protein
MTPIVCVDDLVVFIESVVKDFVLETNTKGIRKAPQVIGGYLEDKKPGAQQNPPDIPYVIVRYLEDNDTDESNTAQFRIIAGTYSQDEQNGWRDVVNVITRIKVALLKKKFIGAFCIERPMRTELPEEQPFPEWVCVLTITVTMPQVQEEGVF